MSVANGGTGSPDVPYLLKHSDREIRRLNHQAGIINPITRRIFLEAGIVPGMRVLDVGSGAGDVALLLSELVSPAGEVVGTDRSPAALAVARARAGSQPIRNVSFREGDPAQLAFEQPFDAAAGRYVLMFQADPAAMLRGIARHLRPGGIAVFHEPDWAGVRSLPPVPTYDRCCRWIVETFRRAGIETQMGVKLHAVFIAAGLPAPSMRLEAIVGGSRGGADWLHQIAELVATMLPEIESRGVATAAELGIDTLAERLRREVDAGGGVVVGRSEIGAWSRRPDR